MINSIRKGGLNVFDVDSLCGSIKAAWAVRYINAKDDYIWCAVANKYNTVNNDRMLLFRMNCTNEKSFHVSKVLSCFYKDVYLAFNKSNYISKEFFERNIFTQSLWGNDYVKCDITNKAEVIVERYITDRKYKFQ